MYQSPFYIAQPIGNNEFSYKERIALGSQAKIYIPSLIDGTVNDLKVGTEIAFEECENGKLHSCVGLQNFIHTNIESIPIYIFDNHNHALFFWYQHLNNLSPFIKGRGPQDRGIFVEGNKDLKPFKVLHIDQHTDIKPNANKLSEPIFDFVNYQCNVGNFIPPAIESGLIDEVIQIRTDTALHNIGKLDFENYNYILDIDMDFRVGKNDIEKDIQIIKNLIKNVSLATIATSPYFIDQSKAIEITKKILN